MAIIFSMFDIPSLICLISTKWTSLIYPVYTCLHQKGLADRRQGGFQHLAYRLINLLHKLWLSAFAHCKAFSSSLCPDLGQTQPTWRWTNLIRKSSEFQAFSSILEPELGSRGVSWLSSISRGDLWRGARGGEWSFCEWIPVVQLAAKHNRQNPFPGVPVGFLFVHLQLWVLYGYYGDWTGMVSPWFPQVSTGRSGRKWILGPIVMAWRLDSLHRPFWSLCFNQFFTWNQEWNTCIYVYKCYTDTWWYMNIVVVPQFNIILFLTRPTEAELNRAPAFELGCDQDPEDWPLHRKAIPQTALEMPRPGFGLCRC